LKPKKREDNITKLTGKFDDVYTTIETKMEERDAGEKGVPAK